MNLRGGGIRKHVNYFMKCIDKTKYLAASVSNLFSNRKISCKNKSHALYKYTNNKNKSLFLILAIHKLKSKTTQKNIYFRTKTVDIETASFCNKVCFHYHNLLLLTITKSVRVAVYISFITAYKIHKYDHIVKK